MNRGLPSTVARLLPRVEEGYSRPMGPSRANRDQNPTCLWRRHSTVIAPILTGIILMAEIPSSRTRIGMWRRYSTPASVSSTLTPGCKPWHRRPWPQVWGGRAVSIHK